MNIFNIYLDKIIKILADQNSFCSSLDSHYLKLAGLKRIPNLYESSG